MASSNTPLRLTSSLYTICVKEFDSLLQSLRTGSHPEAGQLQEPLGRFRVWAHNVGLVSFSYGYTCILIKIGCCSSHGEDVTGL